MISSSTIEQFLSTCHLIQAKGMVSGSGGNVSIRCPEGILITPSGRSLESLSEQDLVLLQKDGSFTCQKSLVPSKEWRMHLACYEREDVQAVVHVHSTNAVAVSCLPAENPECAIPVFTPGYGIRVGKLPLLPYCTPGSQELCEQAARVIAFRNSVLLANHGVLAVGSSLEMALNIAEEIEDEAKLYLLLGSRGRALTEEEQKPLSPWGLRAAKQ